MPNSPTVPPTTPKRIGIAADHGGFELKEYLAGKLREARYEVDRGVAIRGSSVGAGIAANKAPGVWACLIHECFSARQGVEDDNMNTICLGGRVVGNALAWELVEAFLQARFSGAARHRRRLAKVAKLESRNAES